MRYFLLPAFLLFSIIGCTSKKSQSENFNHAFIKHQLAFDIDNNGVIDSFIITNTNEEDSLFININNRWHTFPHSSVALEPFTEPGLLNKNLIADSFFIVTSIGRNKKNMLLVKDRGDFSGPWLIVFLPIDDSIRRFELNEYSELIGLEDLDNDGIYEMKLHTFPAEPGNIPLGGDSIFSRNFTYYLIYKYQNNTVALDSNLTRSYNLKNTPYYAQYLTAKSPAFLFYASYLNKKDSFLVDLDTLKSLPLQ
jgi:hypothetical protein